MTFDRGAVRTRMRIFEARWAVDVQVLLPLITYVELSDGSMVAVDCSLSVSRPVLGSVTAKHAIDIVSS